MTDCNGVGHAWPLCQLDDALIAGASRPINDRQLQVGLWWLAGEHLREAARLAGISQTRAGQIRDQFLRWLRREARLAGRHRPEGRTL